MPNQITGRLTEIGQTVQIPSKNGGQPFTKREFLLDARTYDPYTGQPSEYENILPLELTGERCADLDRFRTGDTVTVSFALQGRSWTNQDGQLRRMVSIRCYKMEPYGSQQQPQAQTRPAPHPAPDYGQFPPSVDVNGNPQTDLPF